MAVISQTQYEMMRSLAAHMQTELKDIHAEYNEFWPGVFCSFGELESEEDPWFVVSFRHFPKVEFFTCIINCADGTWFHNPYYRIGTPMSVVEPSFDLPSRAVELAKEKLGPLSAHYRK